MQHKELIDPQAQMVVSFLQEMGLPHKNIIAEQSQREIMGNNLHQLIKSLPKETKENAR